MQSLTSGTSDSTSGVENFGILTHVHQDWQDERENAFKLMLEDQSIPRASAAHRNYGIIPSLIVINGNYDNYGVIKRLYVKEGTVKNFGSIKEAFLESGRIDNNGTLITIHMKQGVRCKNFGNIKHCHRKQTGGANQSAASNSKSSTSSNVPKKILDAFLNPYKILKNRTSASTSSSVQSASSGNGASGSSGMLRSKLLKKKAADPLTFGQSSATSSSNADAQNTSTSSGEKSSSGQSNGDAKANSSGMDRSKNLKKKTAASSSSNAEMQKASTSNVPQKENDQKTSSGQSTNDSNLNIHTLAIRRFLGSASTSNAPNNEANKATPCSSNANDSGSASSSSANKPDNDSDVEEIPAVIETVDLCAPVLPTRKLPKKSDPAELIDLSTQALPGSSSNDDIDTVDLSSTQAQKDETAKANETQKDPETPKGCGIKCPICLQAVVEREPVSTPCGHIFCKQCLDDTLKARPINQRKCPMCNAKVPKTKPFHRIFLN